MAWTLHASLPEQSVGNCCAVCFVARKGDRYLDGLAIEGEGNFPICELCIREAARLIGMSDKPIVVIREVAPDRDEWHTEWERVEALAEHLVDRLCEHKEDA